jgi:hypothetical protein
VIEWFVVGIITPRMVLIWGGRGGLGCRSEQQPGYDWVEVAAICFKTARWNVSRICHWGTEPTCVSSCTNWIFRDTRVHPPSLPSTSLIISRHHCNEKLPNTNCNSQNATAMRSLSQRRGPFDRISQRPLVRPRQISKIPIDQPPAYFGFGNVDEILKNIISRRS